MRTPPSHQASQGRRAYRGRKGDLRRRWPILVVATVITASATAASFEGSGSADTQEVATAQAVKQKCLYARLGISFYRGMFVKHQLRRGASIPTWRKPRNCADARYLATVWAERSRESRAKTERYLGQIQHRTLHDFTVTPGNNAWKRAVREVQKPYPGTESWLLSCSWAEGKWGRWVSYAGLYTPEYAAAHYVVGGWMQFKYPTFTGMFRHAIEDVLERGFFLPKGLSPDLQGWQSPLAQALAAGWARHTGNDASHWSASWNRGCR